MHRTVLRTLFAAALFAGTATVAVGVEAETPFEEGTLERGHGEFMNSCASCHGEDGKGAGFLVRVFRGVDPGDLTTLAARHDGKFPTLKVFQTIDGRSQVAAHGDRKMPVWGGRYREEQGGVYGPYGGEALIRARVLELTYYLESIQEQ